MFTVEPIQTTIRTIFAVVALILFILAGLGLPEKPSFRYIGWGLAFLTVAFFLFVSWS
jgi:hypothetical protein